MDIADKSFADAMNKLSLRPLEDMAVFPHIRKVTFRSVWSSVEGEKIIDITIDRADGDRFYWRCEEMDPSDPDGTPGNDPGIDMVIAYSSPLVAHEAAQGAISRWLHGNGA